MKNELLIILSLVFIYSMTLVTYKFWGKSGLYCFSAITTVLANIEVLMLINAFGIEQTLGNVLFASTFLITDILSECEGKKYANKAVIIGIFSSVFFLILSQSWLLYTPIAESEITSSIRTIFSTTPRLIFSSLAVYTISQFIDVWLYHKWWSFTENRFNDKRKFLWLRNNGSTLISQLINAFLFNFFAFLGVYDFMTVLSISISTYVIYIFTSLLDTPVVYLARRIYEKKQEKQEKTINR